MSVDHWMMFATFGQQDYFEYPNVGTYKGVVINANMVAYAPSGLAAFLLEKTASATYVVDPLTHAFQHEPEAVSNPDREPKTSVASLAEVYGEPVASRVGLSPVLPQHFANHAVLEGFVERALEFQYNHLTDYMGESDASKYLDPDEVQSHPYALVAPYFYLTEASVDRWLDVNARMLQHAVKVAGALRSRLFGAVVIGQGVLGDSSLRKKVSGALRDTGVDGFVVWVDDFDEAAASGRELDAFVQICRSLRGANAREVLNLHGGYFSVLAAGVLGGGALTGVTHGPEFGESRPVVPVGGGIPIARYYVPQLHVRVRYRDALRWFQAKGWLSSASAFHENVCDCPVCKDTLKGNPANFRAFGEANVRAVRRGRGIVRIGFPTREAKHKCLCHYLERKRREFEAAASAPSNVLLQNLETGALEFEDVAGLEGVGHLRIWHRVLSASWRANV